MANRIQFRRDSSDNWNRLNPILADGEPGLEYDTNKVKIGDGSNTWSSLSYATVSSNQSLNTTSEVAFYTANIGGLNVTGAITLPNSGVANGIQSVDGRNTIYFETDNSIQFIANNTFQTSFNADGTVQFGGGYIFPNTPGTSGQVLVYNPSGSGEHDLQWQTLSGGSGGGSGITLTSLRVGTPNAPSGDGSLSYNNTTGTFTFTPPNLSGYVTGTPWTSQGYLTSSSLSGYVQSSSLSTVATSGSYLDLSHTPDLSVYYTSSSSIPSSQITGLSTVATSGRYNDLTNKPTKLSQFIDDLPSEPSFEYGDSNFNALSGHRYGIDTSAGVVSATLPASPTVGDAIYFMDFGGDFSTNNFVIIRNGNTIMNQTSDLSVSIDGQSFGLAWTGTTWRVYS